MVAEIKFVPWQRRMARAGAGESARKRWQRNHDIGAVISPLMTAWRVQVIINQFQAGCRAQRSGAGGVLAWRQTKLRRTPQWPSRLERERAIPGHHGQGSSGVSGQFGRRAQRPCRRFANMFVLHKILPKRHIIRLPPCLICPIYGCDHRLQHADHIPWPSLHSQWCTRIVEWHVGVNRSCSALNCHPRLRC